VGNLHEWDIWLQACWCSQKFPALGLAWASQNGAVGTSEAVIGPGRVLASKCVDSEIFVPFGRLYGNLLKDSLVFGK
jgi:hypothetical protein